MDGIMSTLKLCSDIPYINDMMQAYLFVICVVIIERLFSLPFSMYDTFVIEEKFGLNKTTKTTFTKDEIKKFILQLIMYAILVPVLLYIIEKAGKAMIPTLAGVCILSVITVTCLIPTLH